MTTICLDDDMEPFLQRAEAMGRRDYAHRIDIMDGMNAFKSAGATREELIRYGEGWSNEMLRSILKASEFVFEDVE